MTTLNPKDVFLTFHGEEQTELSRQHDKPWLQTSLSLALAQYASLGATSEQIMGAKRFADILLSLHVKNETPAAFPVKRLETFEPGQPITPTK